MCWKLFARPGFTYQCHQEWEINLNQKSSLPLLPLCTVLQGRHPPRRRQPRTEDVCWSVKYWYFQFLHYGWKSCSGAKRIKKLASGVAACACKIANHCDLNRLFIHEGEYEAHWWHEQKTARNGICAWENLILLFNPWTLWYHLSISWMYLSISWISFPSY